MSGKLQSSPHFVAPLNEVLKDVISTQNLKGLEEVGISLKWSQKGFPTIYYLSFEWDFNQYKLSDHY